MLKKISELAAIKSAKFIGSWWFILFFSAISLAWMALHYTGALKIDTLEFVKWSWAVSYFAMIQASILLMAAERQDERDRKRDVHTNRLAKASAERIVDIQKTMDVMEEFLEDLIEENRNKSDE